MKRLGRPEGEAAVREAAEAIEGGHVVVAPGETCYLAMWDAGSVELTGSLGPGTERGAESSGGMWLARTAAEVEESGIVAHAVHRRLLRRLTPGPVVFASRLTEEQIAAVRERLGAAPGSIDRANEGLVCVRLVSEPVTASVVLRSARTVAAAELTSGGRPARQAAVAVAALESLGISPAIVLDDGPSRLNKPATVIVLERADPGGKGRQKTGPGGWSIKRTGVLEERFIKKQLERLVLFVCTGNTCRSPMAEAIAADLVDAGHGGPGLRVESAGTAATGGVHPTPEAMRALESMGIRPRLRRGGGEGRRSRALTRQLIAEADVLFGMTPTHVRAVMVMDPSAAAKVKLLDPEGKDVPDPLGGPQAVYDETALRMRDMIARRLKELEQ